MTEEEVKELFEDLERPITNVKMFGNRYSNEVIVKAFFNIGRPEIIGRFNARHVIKDSDIVGKSKIEAIYYLDHKRI